MKNLICCFIIVAIAFYSSGCATIIGGSKYWANVEVRDNPYAKINYKGQYMGTGKAMFKVPRREANRFSFSIQEEGCREETVKFKKRKFRGWSLVGTLLGWTGFTPGAFIPLPWGVALDGITGSWWKPDDKEKGVFKVDFNNYMYTVDYHGCDHDQRFR